MLLPVIEFARALDKLRVSILPMFGNIKSIVSDITHCGGRPLLVGGAVRDLLWDLPIKDLDIEVYGLSLETLESILKRYGVVRTVGKQFGVLRIDGIDSDWSIPRKDSEGRKPHVVCDPYMSLKKAFARRDVTINAMGIDLVHYTLEDPFNGVRDMRLGILRAPDPELFVHDPLRFFRIMQFVARFDVYPDNELQGVCKKMSLQGIAQERIFSEFEKMIIQSSRPSLGFQWLFDVGRLQECLPELFDTVTTVQDPLWHPEGSVFEHTKQAVDAAAQQQYKDSSERLIVVYAALCHDLGKVVTTREIDGRVRALGHDVKGVFLARSMLKRITNKQNVIDAVSKLVRYHMMPVQFVVNKTGDSAYKRLALKLAPEITLHMLCRVATADKRGRNPKKNGPLDYLVIPEVECFFKKACSLGVAYGPELPILQGKDLLDYVPSGRGMGILLEQAYEIQIEEGIIDKDVLKKRVLGSLMHS